MKGENGSERRLRGRMSCASRDVVYAIVCRKCRVMGIGETSDFRARFSQYVDGVQRQVAEGGILQHFRNHVPSDLSVTLLESLRPELKESIRPAIRLRLESVWQDRLQASLNVKRTLRSSFSEWIASKRRREQYED